MTITAIDGTSPSWVLRYTPESSTPFFTLEGTSHSWFWDFVSGAMMKDGEQLNGYTITIEREL
jgi:hypothetical protein